MICTTNRLTSYALSALSTSGVFALMSPGMDKSTDTLQVGTIPGRILLVLPHVELLGLRPFDNDPYWATQNVKQRLSPVFDTDVP